MNKRMVARWFALIIFSCSLFVFFFSIYQVLRERNQVDEALQAWESRKEAAAESITEAESLYESAQDDPMGSFQPVNHTKETASNIQPPKQGEVIGKVSIPSLNQEFPLIEGTDPSELAKGVGHYTSSALPGEIDNSVIAGHRDTVFRDVGKMAEGDKIIIETTDNTYTYEVFKRQIVDKEDRTIIVSSEQPILTVVTCYPFHYVGPAPKRYILTAKLLKP